MKSKFVTTAAAAAVACLTFTPAKAQKVVPGQPMQTTYTNGVYGNTVLSPGFLPDPVNINVQAGGPLDVSGIVNGCDGYMTDQPSYIVNFTAQGTAPLIFSVNSGDDTTIMVRSPDGVNHCDDDSGQNGDNPSLAFQSPRAGEYRVWVGRFWNANPAAATLSISEHSSY